MRRLLVTTSVLVLATVVDLVSRQRAGAITLSDEGRRLIAAMLHSSADAATC